MRWIPRDLNSFADHLSSIIDFDDNTINDNVFQILDARWGPHTIDRFACSYNAELSRFNSRFYQPGTEAVDAFLQHWGFENKWLLPLVSQIARVVDHLRLCNAEGTLVIPMWKSSCFRVSLCNDERHGNSFVHDWVVLSKFKQLFVRGKAENGMFGARELSLAVVALRISFKLPERRNQARFCALDSGCCFICCIDWRLLYAFSWTLLLLHGLNSCLLFAYLLLFVGVSLQLFQMGGSFIFRFVSFFSTLDKVILLPLISSLFCFVFSLSEKRFSRWVSGKILRLRIQIYNPLAPGPRRPFC